MFPLDKKNVTLNDSETDFLSNYTHTTEIPVLPHPGAFAKVRTHHIHEGIDLYCNPGDVVRSIENGVVVGIGPFTGPQVQSDWWNDTWYVMVEGVKGVFVYGEIIPNPTLKVGRLICEGDKIGNVTTVLKKDKGRPMTMLHLELYEPGVKAPMTVWKRDMSVPRPRQLQDATLNMMIEAGIL